MCVTDNTMIIIVRNLPIGNNLLHRADNKERVLTCSGEPVLFFHRFFISGTVHKVSRSTYDNCLTLTINFLLVSVKMKCWSSTYSVIVVPDCFVSCIRKYYFICRILISWQPF